MNKNSRKTETTDPETLKEYMVYIGIDTKTFEIISMQGAGALTEWYNARRPKLKAIADTIREKIMPHHTIRFISDEDGYAISGSKRGEKGHLIVKTTQHAADEIKKIEGVLGVAVNNIFYWVPPVATLKQ